MTREERKLLQQIQFQVEHLLTIQHPDVCITKGMKDPSLAQLLDMVNLLRVFVKYGLLDLESTRREKAALAKALKEKERGN